MAREHFRSNRKLIVLKDPSPIADNSFSDLMDPLTTLIHQTDREMTRAIIQQHNQTVPANRLFFDVSGFRGKLANS